LIIFIELCFAKSWASRNSELIKNFLSAFETREIVRCSRLSDPLQVRADRWATYGGLAGLGIGAVAGPGLLPGLMVGFTAGTVSSGLYGMSQAKAKKSKDKAE